MHSEIETLERVKILRDLRKGEFDVLIGICARHLHGRAILYADRITDSMKRAMDETLRRREIQTAYNLENGITPESIVRPLDMTLAGIVAADYTDLTGGEAEGMPEF